MHINPAFQKIFKSIQTIVPDNYFESDNHALRVYSFACDETSNTGKLKIWTLVEDGVQVNATTDWCFHHKLWFFENPLDQRVPCRFTAHVEILDSHREKIIVLGDPDKIIAINFAEGRFAVQKPLRGNMENMRLFA